MNYILTTISLIFCLCSFAQQKSDIIYLTRFGDPTGSKDSAEYYRVVKEVDGLYRVNEYSIKSDSLHMTGVFKDKAQTIKEGEFIDYEKGIPLSRMNFKDGKLTGQQITYYPSGEVFYTEEYINGKQEGYLRAYYKDGKLKREEKYEADVMKSGDCYLANGEKTEYFEFMTAAAYPTDDMAGLKKFLMDHIKYPRRALEDGIMGKVYVHFVVSKTGELEDVAIRKSASPLLDQEALRVVKAMPKWKPATIDGEAVDSFFSLPISFKF